jgi:hypothetical protein
MCFAGRRVAAAYTAVAEATCRTLLKLYGQPNSLLALAHRVFFLRFPPAQVGRDWGKKVAGQILADRNGDGSNKCASGTGKACQFVRYASGQTFAPYEHRQDPTKPKDNQTCAPCPSPPLHIFWACILKEVLHCSGMLSTRS